MGLAANKGSVCRLAGATQGQKMLGGRQGGVGPAAGPGALPDTFLWLLGKREHVWAQGKCTATAAPAHCLAHRPTSLGQLGPTVSPAMPQPPSPPQAGPPPRGCAVSPTLLSMQGCSLLGAAKHSGTRIAVPS